MYKMVVSHDLSESRIIVQVGDLFKLTAYSHHPKEPHARKGILPVYCDVSLLIATLNQIGFVPFLVLWWAILHDTQWWWSTNVLVYDSFNNYYRYIAWLKKYGCVLMSLLWWYINIYIYIYRPHSLLFLHHDDVIKWKHFPRNWPFVRRIHRSPVNSPHKGQWRGALMFSLIFAWINGWVNNSEAGDLRRYRGHYDVSVMPRRVWVKHQMDSRELILWSNPNKMKQNMGVWYFMGCTDK